MQSNIDWPAIRAGYERGLSKSALAREYGVSRQVIQYRAKIEQWIEPLFASPSDHFAPLQNNKPEEEMSTVEKAIVLISERLDEKPDNKDIKMLMDSLSQAYKIKQIAPSTDKPAENGIPADLLQYLSMEQLTELSELEAHQEKLEARKNEILETAKEKKLEQEQGIKTIRKTS
jgi:hypothetical protein